MKKSFLVIMLAVLMVLTNVSFVFASSPVEMNVKQATETYNEASGGAETIISPNSQNPKIGMTTGDYAVFSVNISEAGDYSLFFYAGTKTADTKIKVLYKTGNGEYTEALTGDVTVNNSTINVAATVFGTISLPSGTVDIKFEAVSGNCNFSKFILERATAFEISSVTANKDEIAVTQNVVVPRSTSLLNVKFSGSLNTKTVDGNTVKLLDGDEEVEISVAASTSDITITICETLDYDKEYTLKMNGVKNAANSSEIADFDLIFKTSTKEADTGSADIKEDTSGISVRNVYISGKLIDSNGVGVKGREISVYLGEELLEVLITKDEGAFDFSYILPKNSKGGEYHFKLVGEYAEERFYTVTYDENAATAALSQKFNVTQRNSSLCNPENDTIIKPDSENPYISFNWGVGNYDYQTFDVNVAESGYYAISMIANCGNGNKVKLSYSVGASADYTDVVEITTTTTNGVFAPLPMALVELPEGLVRIRFTMTYADISFSGFELKYLSQLEALEINANGTKIEDGDTVKRGTDVFEISYSQQVDASLENAEISLKDENGNALAIETKANDKTVSVNLKETLDYNKNYTLLVSGIKDSFGAYTAEEVEISFKTSDVSADGGSAQIVQAQAVCNYIDITIKAQMLSSGGSPISGRKFEIYMKSPDGTVSQEPVVSGISGDDGEISGNVKMSLEDTLGIYSFIIKGEYVATEATCEVDYNAKAFGVEKITANAENVLVEENTVLKRSTSIFTVEFTGKVDMNTLTDENIVLLNGSRVVPIKITQDSLKTKISPVYTLDYDSEYTLCIDGVKDEPGIYKITNYSIKFKTSAKAEDNMKDEIIEPSSSIAGRAVSVKGTLVDSNEIGLAGREVYLYFTPINGVETTDYVTKTLTKENGLFTLAYSLPDGAEEGDYTFRAVSEYGASETYTVTYDKEAAINALTQKINVTDHNAALSIPADEQIFSQASGSFISFNGFKNDVQVFDIVIPEGGIYAMNLLAGTGAGAAMNIYYTLDGTEEEVLIKELSTISTGGVSSFGSQPIGYVEFPAGNVRIKFIMTNSDIHFQGFEIKYLNKIEVSKVSANGTFFENGDTVSRGTDLIEVQFTESVNTDLEKATIELKDENGENITFTKTVSEKTLSLKLTKSLEYNKGYNLKISGVEDLYGAYKVSDYTLSFASGDESSDKGSAQLTEVSGNVNYAEMTIKAKMLSSQGEPISGRKVEIFIKNPEGVLSTEAVYSGVSGANGEISYKHIMSDDDMGGKYTFIIKGDYVSQQAEVELIYISKEIEETISNGIKNAGSALEIEELLKENEVVLDINLEKDLDGISDIEKVFNHIKGETANTLNEIKTLYRAAIALEKINQAIIPARIDVVLSDGQACKDLGLDKARMDLITDEDGGLFRTNFISDVLALDVIENIEDVKDALEDAINKNLAQKLGKLELTSAAENVSGAKGDGVALALSTVEVVNDVEEITFYVKADENIVKKASAVSDAGKVTTKVNGNMLTVEITPDKTLKNIKNFGTVYLATEVAEGNYDVKVSADVNYKIKYETLDEEIMVNVTGEMAEKTVVLTVNKKGGIDTPQRPSSTSPGASRPSGGGSGSGGTSQIPPTQTEEPKPTETPEEFGFVDLEEASWAKESIEKLLEKGIVSESEDKKFNPNNNVKREEFIKLIVLAKGIYDETAKCDFNDVSEDSWYYTYVASAYKAGITNGRDDGSFGVGDSVTREEMAAMIYRALGEGLEKGEGAELFADDETIAEYAKEAVYVLKNNNVINGMGDNLYEPRGLVTRAQAAKVIAGLIK